jgi:hypothetical protein
MKDLDADTELVDYLRLAAELAGVSVAVLLRKVFHVNALRQEPGFQGLFGSLDDATMTLLMRLDERLRILNPGLHYVFRTSYLGYRREGGTYITPLAERSQIFLSVVPRIGWLRVVLPVDPVRYASQPGCRSLTGQGHHGVGELQVDITNPDALNGFFMTFGDWLASPRT